MTRDEFIRLLHELRLPVADPDLVNNFDQEVNWRSINVVRLFVAMQKRTGRRVPVADLFEQRTVRGIWSLFAAPEVEQKGA